METKYVVLVVLLLAVLAVWLLPRTRFAASLSLTERGYSLMHWTGAVSGLAGIIATLLLPDTILQDHLFEILMLPALGAYAVYPAIVARVRKTDELYDEKQIWDTTRAAALSLAATSMSMFIVYAFYNEQVLSGTIWFPLLMFSVVGWYSAGTLYLHTRS